MKRLTLSLLATLFTIMISASNVLTIKVGETSDLTKIPVYLIMTNDTPMKAFQVSFALPKGLSKENFNEDEDAADIYCVLGDRASKNHIKNTVEMFTSTNPNDLLLSVTPGVKTDTFAPGSDVVATFTFDGSSLADGNYAVKLYGAFLLIDGKTRIDCEDMEATFTVKHTIPVTGITLNKTTNTLTEGESFTLTATVNPEDATNKDVVWTSSDESVATVSNGVVVAVAPGNATITVTAADGSKAAASCSVTVEKKIILVSSIALDKTENTLTEGDSFTLTATVNPDDATNKDVVWTSSDESVATVSNGVVVAVAPGNATITVTAADGSKAAASCSVTVEKKIILVSSIALDKTENTLTEGESFTLTATVNPDDATNKDVVWTSSDESVATVSNGVVVAVAPGNATITVTAADGSIASASCNVTVEKKIILVSSIALDKTENTLTEGESFTLTATVNPDDATNKDVVWTSSDESVATVSNGVVVAVAPGNATITVTAADGSKASASCNVTVEKKIILVSSIALDKTENTLTEGESFTLTATVNPDDATNKDVVWTSSDESVATVSNGVVVAVAPGNATITVTAADGSKAAASCSVTVEKKIILVSSIALDKYENTLTEGESFTLTATVNPDDATNKDVVWTSSDESVATVSNGVVVAVAPGNATITVTAADGSKASASCNVTVEKKIILVSSIALDKTENTLTEGESFTLTASVNPDDATNKDVVWTSSDESVATVSNGVVVAVAPGNATIAVTAADGSKASASCNVTVEEVNAIGNIVVDGKSIKVYNLNGVCVATSKAEYDNLTKGIYIINNKKVYK